jgi:septal ring factor EnvC (AmiA/AmiB activator)
VTPPSPLRRARLLAPLLAFAALALLAPAGETPSREEELAAIRAEVARLEQRLAGLGDRRATAADRLETLEVELALQEERLAEATAAAALAAEEAARSAAEVARLESELDAAREDLSRRLAGLYRLGSQGHLRLLLALDPGGEALAGIRLLRYLARRDAAAVERYTAARDRLLEERELLAARRLEVERWQAAEDRRRGELATARARQERALAELDAERRRLAARAGELGERAERLARFLDLLAGQSGGGPAGIPIQELQGVLDWPVAGDVTAGFGFRLDPRYRTRIPHNGLTIATRAGDEVRAVYAGEVLFAAPFQGYGPTAVVLHPGRVFSLYAGLAALAVEPRQTVELGQPVGRAADSLYFEIRVGERPEDPRRWLR